MPHSRVIDAINAFIDAKTWEKAAKGSALIFGVENEKGAVEYAVVSGRENGYALALCPDAQALAGYAALLDLKRKNGDELEQVGLQLDLSCLEVRLIPEKDAPLNRWVKVFGMEDITEEENMPSFLRYDPGMLPDFPDEDDEDRMRNALMAAADFSVNPEAAKRASEAQENGGLVPCAKPDGKGGFLWGAVNIAGSMNLQYPSPALEDELAARRLRRIPVSGAEVRCAVRRLPMPMDAEVLTVPTVMILVDDRQGVVAAPMVEDYDSEYSTFAGEYIGYVEENGRPKRILATDPRTYCLLSGLAEQMSTPIQRVGSMPEINDAVNGLMEFLKSKVEAEQAEHGLDGEMKLPEFEPGIGGVLLDGYHGTMEEVGAHLLQKYSKQAEEENLLIRATYPDDPTFWMYAAVKTDAALRNIDKYLRDEWVECCGHSSLFRIGGIDYTSNTRILPGKSMNARVTDVMREGDAADYEYDIGTPTDLKVELVGRVLLAKRREKVLHLAQNFMPAYKCVRCGRRAELVARPGMEPIVESVICARCSREMAEVGAYLPLINSPRTGVCGFGMWFDDEDDE